MAKGKRGALKPHLQRSPLANPARGQGGQRAGASQPARGKAPARGKGKR